ncbi:divalent-cation tolerance protein CutA [Paraconexibacter algicola]|uniref:Divalent-cation tolerance protein CutA n=1 Tax=Paraconexibacter algicola TaxID=2133960 RepID=A0A2T4UJ86_9ACTN|nr:divalent-cation tolerance protein CutA [Paraconexibacter algicola]PTL59298.1 divalent-cation tolerance protein CutA [Paraconexibacter algicola]
MAGERVCLVTAPAERADDIARVLVQERLAACVNIVPSVRSVYRWEGEVQQGEEALLVVKTTADRLVALDARLADVHPYDTYELVALEVTGGNAAYLAWIGAGVTPG